MLTDTEEAPKMADRHLREESTSPVSRDAQIRTRA